jgi:hypothetical protein
MAWLGAAVVFAGGAETQPRFVVSTNVAGVVDDRLFGQFLERGCGSEAGADHGLVPGTNEPPPTTAACAITTRELPFQNGTLPVILPARTPNIIEAPLPGAKWPTT